jgi:hypothetical protein
MLQGIGSGADAGLRQNGEIVCLECLAFRGWVAATRNAMATRHREKT